MLVSGEFAGEPVVEGGFESSIAPLLASRDEGKEKFLW